MRGLPGDDPRLVCWRERYAQYDASVDPALYTELRALLAEAAAGPANVRYLRIEPERLERDVTLFLDASHMGPCGRNEYSAAFLEAVRELLPAR